MKTTVLAMLHQDSAAGQERFKARTSVLGEDADDYI